MGLAAWMAKKKRNAFLLAFLIPFAAYLFLLIACGVWPFGEACMLHVDMYHQYCPFFTEFADKLKSGGSLLYSWNIGLGSDFTALMAYYLASPTNWLLLLCPRSLVIEFMELLILLKIAGSGCSMFVFLSEHFSLFDEKKESGRRMLPAALAFSTAYAFSGFICAYYWDIMWLDGIMLFPLILLGLFDLVRQGRPALYFITLSLTILCNYYIAIMICIFLLFAFLVLLVENKGRRCRAAGQFFLCSLLSGGTGAVLLLPEIAMLAYSGSSFEGFPDGVQWYFSIISELTRSSFLAEGYTGSGQWPNLYAGTFTLLLALLYFFNRQISLRKKLIRGGAIVFFWLSFSNNYLDFIWHGLHFPSSLPARESFLYIFLLLSLGFSALLNWQGNTLSDLAQAGALWVLFFAFAYLKSEAEGVTETALLLTALLIVSYVLLLVLWHLAGPTAYRRVMPIFCLTAIAELVVNMGLTGTYTISRTAYLAPQEDYANLLALAEEESAGAFFRLEDTERKTKNDGALYGYASATTFSSLMNIEVGRLYQSLGMEGGKNFYSSNGAVPLVSAMLSIKYEISDSAYRENEMWTMVGSSGRYYLYENNYCLPLGFMVPSDLSDDWDNTSSDRHVNINNLAYLLGADEDLLTIADASVTETAGYTVVTASQTGSYFASYPSCSSDTLTVTDAGGGSTTYSKASHRYLLDLFSIKAGESVTIESSREEMIHYTIYAINWDVMDTLYDRLFEQTMALSEQTDKRIGGSITVTQEGDLFFSIPAEEGWHLYVDGEEREWESFSGALITVPLSAGTHEIELVYRTPYLLLGAAVSLGCVAVFILIMCFLHKKRKKLS